MSSPNRFALHVWITRAALIACALSALLSSSAWANSRVVVRAFRGPKGSDVRAVVVKELNARGFEIVANKDVDAMAKARGVPVDEPSGRAVLSSELTVHAWIDGRVNRAGGEFTTVITVQSATGDELMHLTVRRRQAKQLVPTVRRDLWKMLGPAIENAPAPQALPPFDAAGQAGTATPNTASASAPQPGPPTSHLAWPTEVYDHPASDGADESQVREDTDEKERKRELSAIEAAVSMNSFARTLRFRDTPPQGIPDYELGAAPVVVGSLRMYPGVFADSTIAGCIGVEGTFQRAFALGSESASGVVYRTKFDGFTGSLVGRIPFARHEVNLLAGYGLQRFLIEESSGALPPVPGVEYRHIRLGAAGRFALGARTTLGLEANWLAILSTGPLGTDAWFRRSSGFGFEGSFYVDVHLFAGLAARARASYQRSALDFAPQSNSPRSERGAVDTYMMGGIGLSYTLAAHR